MDPSEVEFGSHFITLYFPTNQRLYEVSSGLYKIFEGLKNFKHFELQRRNFAHLPGDIPIFHGGIDEFRPHFHIIYPYKPTQADLDFLLLWGKRLNK